MSHVYTLRDNSAAIRLDGPETNKIVSRVVPGTYEPVEELGRVFVADPEAHRASWRWHFEPLGEAPIRSASPDARTAAWALAKWAS